MNRIAFKRSAVRFVRTGAHSLDTEKKKFELQIRNDKKVGTCAKRYGSYLIFQYPIDICPTKEDSVRNRTNKIDIAPIHNILMSKVFYVDEAT